MRNLSAWRLILNSLEEDIPVMLLYVLDSRGSSPGRRGFFMAVNARDEMEGSIGGGIMEHKFVEMVREKLRVVNNELPDHSLRRQVHDKSTGKDQSGMICSGEQTIFLLPVSNSDKHSVERLVNSLEDYRNGELSLSPEGLSFSEKIPGQDFYFQMTDEYNWLYKEKTGHKNHLSIIGGGHCSLALSKLMREMDFYIRVFDDRSGLKTMEQNSFAHSKYLLGSYAELGEKMNDVQNHYVVIMTFGYRTDDQAVRALVNRNFTYLGLLGSSRKIQAMMEEYKKEGLPADWLRSIHSPIGIQIRSQTPEEIAVSIAAEIIRVKNSNLL